MMSTPRGGGAASQKVDRVREVVHIKSAPNVGRGVNEHQNYADVICTLPGLDEEGACDEGVEDDGEDQLRETDRQTQSHPSVSMNESLSHLEKRIMG